VTSDGRIAATIWHVLYPKLNFYDIKYINSDKYRRILNVVKELREKGIING
jgi:GH35 family endo-1,4-beta-xylanase